MIITNTQLHEATPAQVNTTTTWEELQKEEQELEDEITRNWLNGDEGNDVFTDAELEAMQDDLFVPQDQRHLDRLSYLAINELVTLPQQPGHIYDSLDADLLDIICSTLRLENALGIIDIWE